MSLNYPRHLVHNTSVNVGGVIGGPTANQRAFSSSIQLGMISRTKLQSLEGQIMEKRYLTPFRVVYE